MVQNSGKLTSWYEKKISLSTGFQQPSKVVGQMGFSEPTRSPKWKKNGRFTWKNGGSLLPTSRTRLMQPEVMPPLMSSCNAKVVQDHRRRSQGLGWGTWITGGGKPKHPGVVFLFLNRVHTLQTRPIPVISRSYNSVYTKGLWPQLPIYMAIYRGYNSIYNLVRAHLMWMRMG